MPTLAIPCARCDEIGAVRMVQRITQGTWVEVVYYCAICQRTWQTSHGYPSIAVETKNRTDEI
jgi:hypothetical protein